MSQNTVIFEARGVNKFFGPTHANRDIDFRLRRGEIHALAGENGSGKSTLISIICGITAMDSGEMYVDGRSYSPKSPLDAGQHKIGFVVQELGLLPWLPVGINMFLGNMGKYKKFGFLNTNQIYKDAENEIKRQKFPSISSRVKAGNLPVEKRKLVEITKALLGDPDILILDETTQALSYDQRIRLYEIIKEQKAKGTAILIVSHDLEELAELADTITVLRDGANVGELTGSEINVNTIRKLMVGREVKGDYYRADKEVSFRDTVALEVRNLSLHGKFEDISFDLHDGEILAIGGLSDAGIHELGKVIAGAVPPSAGTVRDVKKNKLIRHPVHALKSGMAYVPKDRDQEALMMGTNIRSNLCLPSINDLANKAGLISPRKVRQLSYDASKKFNVRCLGIDQPISALSGGNKQKISIGRWLIKDLNVIVMDCPTRGVDVSVKAYIYALMKQLKEQGIAMILIADEMAEAIGMADRLMVLKNGKISSILNRNEDITQAKVIEVMI